MVDYNYIHGFLQNYGIYITQVQRCSQEWDDVTQNFAKELYQVLYNEEKYQDSATFLDMVVTNDL